MNNLKQELEGKELELVEKIEEEIEGTEFVEVTGGVDTKKAFLFRSHKEKSDFNFLMKSTSILKKVYGKDFLKVEVYSVD